LANDALSSLSQVKRDLSYLETHLLIRKLKPEKLGRGWICAYEFLELDAPEEFARALSEATKGGHTEPLFCAQKRGPEAVHQKHGNGSEEVQKWSKASDAIRKNDELEPITRKEIKPSRSDEREESDTRHAPVREAIRQAQGQCGVPEQWDGHCAKELSRWLASNPNVSALDAIRFVTNKFLSEEARGDPPWKWIPLLSRYAEGPLDRYGQLKETDHEEENEAITGSQIFFLNNAAAFLGTSGDASEDPIGGPALKRNAPDPNCSDCGGTGWKPHQAHPGQEHICNCTYPPSDDERRAS
jgi:hypothetical protein